MKPVQQGASLPGLSDSSWMAALLPPTASRSGSGRRPVARDAAPDHCNGSTDGVAAQDPEEVELDDANELNTSRDHGEDAMRSTPADVAADHYHPGRDLRRTLGHHPAPT
jgi:hypothetical protein